MNVKKGKLFDYIESLFENIETLKMLAFGSSLFLIAWFDMTKKLRRKNTCEAIGSFKQCWLSKVWTLNAPLS